MTSSAHMRPYQRAGIEFLTSRRGAILADQMGLGKTAQALRAWHSCGAHRLLIVCPAYVRNVWLGELTKWCDMGSADVFLPRGRKSLDGIPAGAQVVVCHYDILEAWAGALGSWSEDVILDEAHVLVSNTSKRAKAVKELANNARHVWALTGTPLTGHLRGLWNLLDTVAPRKFGYSFHKFGERYGAGHQAEVAPMRWAWKYDGESHRDELRARLMPFMLRRTLDEVALELPPKTRQVMHVGDEGACAPSFYAADMSSFSAQAVQRALEASYPAKREMLLEMLRDDARSGAKTVVFTHTRKAAQDVADFDLGNGVMQVCITGEVAAERRAALLAAAEAYDGPVVLSATIDSCGTGISMAFAQSCVFAELSYEPHKLLQAEARLHRFGQSRPVFVRYLVARGTIDETVSDVIVRKLESFESAVGSVGDSLAGELGYTEQDALDELFAAVSAHKGAAE